MINNLTKKEIEDIIVREFKKDNNFPSAQYILNATRIATALLEEKC